MHKAERWLKNIKAVGWDLDGTLYPPGAIPFEAVEKIKYKKLMERTGWDREKVEQEYRRLYEQLNSHTKTLTALGVNGVEFFVDLWNELALENYIKRDRKAAALIERVGGAGYRQFVLSNSNRENQIEQKLQLIGIKPSAFEFLVSTVGMDAVKPDPKPFLVALERLNLNANEVLYVGDRERTDIVGAKQVGIRTCLVWGTSEVADIACPTVYDVGKFLV